MTPSATAAAAHLDPALPALGTLFDADSLTRVLGRPVRADRLRHKRGVSAVARLRSAAPVPSPQPGAGAAPRWLAAYAPGREGKLGKTLRRALEEGYDVDHAEVPGHPGHLLVTGPIALDPKLHRALRAFTPEDEPLAFAAGSVLNYNPHRRVVFRLPAAGGTVVCKVEAGGPREAPLLGALAARGIPVLERTFPPGLPSASGIRYYPWFGSGDLQALARAGRSGEAEEAARAAGAALAALHAQPVGLSITPRHDALDKLRLVVTRNTRLLPTEHARLEAALTAVQGRLLRDPTEVLVHGDFSADQVLVGGGEVRLADFDRSTVAPPCTDLGSFAAVDLLAEAAGCTALRSSLVEAYWAAGGPGTPSALAAWTAAHLLDRLDEPFRGCSPDWRAEMTTRLDQVEGLLR